MVTVCITLFDLICILPHMNYHVKLTYAIRITPTPLRTGQYLEKRWLHDLWVCHVIRLELRPRPCAETLW